ncbi:zinc-binding dehydrogenase [Gluconobacter japonicus]|uniref:zinc-binding dehydrogenase n=1 Tax=Gluconobacter japonicus TaxID=376620 RepID=UPI003D2B8E30
MESQRNPQIQKVFRTLQVGAVRPVIDSEWKLEEYEEAYKRLASRQAIGTILLKA